MKNKRLLIGIICLLLFGIAIKWRMCVVVEKRNAPIVSFAQEWARQGKPVVIQKIKKTDVPTYTKVTSWQVAPKVFEGHVSKDVRDQLRVGQEMIFQVDGKSFKGEISMISENIFLDTGMYPIFVEFEDIYEISNWLVAYAHTGTRRNVISIPNEVIERSDDGHYVWKIAGEKAVKQPIKILERSNHGLIVREGLKEGEFVVVAGYSKLQEGDKVKILSGREGGPVL